MPQSTFLQGIRRLLNCSKAQVAAAGLTTTWLAVRYAVADLPPTQRASLWVAFIGAVAIQLREVINAWTEEDVANAAGPQATVASNQLPQTPGPPPPASAPAASLTNMPFNMKPPIATKPLSSTTLPQRSPAMPLRTKLPLIAIACALFAPLTGCQSPPELAIYREGLHKIDEPLYQAHLLLMDDAVKANIRTDADRQVVQQGIGAARSLYQENGSAKLLNAE